MRGDRPSLYIPSLLKNPFTPHARGSTLPDVLHQPAGRVYPACAGIDLVKNSAMSPVSCLPRMRGDRPPCYDSKGYTRKFTPHARGSTVYRHHSLTTQHVYPACAGIDPGQERTSTIWCSLPRMRGDRPRYPESPVPLAVFTPHARGSTHPIYATRYSPGVYPACAGIDLSVYGRDGA